MNRCLRNPIAEILWFCIVSVLALAQFQEPLPKLNYLIIPDFFQLPPEEHFIEPAGVAVNSKGHIYVFHRGNSGGDSEPRTRISPTGHARSRSTTAATEVDS